MKHLADPARTVFDHDSPITDGEAETIASMNADQLREVIESRFTERWAYCGVNLKDPSNTYTIAMHAGREVGFSAMCGDCLGALDEVRRREGKPPLHEVRAAEKGQS